MLVTSLTQCDEWAAGNGGNSDPIMCRYPISESWKRKVLAAVLFDKACQESDLAASAIHVATSITSGWEWSPSIAFPLVSKMVGLWASVRGGNLQPGCLYDLVNGTGVRQHFVSLALCDTEGIPSCQVHSLLEGNEELRSAVAGMLTGFCSALK